MRRYCTPYILARSRRDVMSQHPSFFSEFSLDSSQSILSVTSDSQWGSRGRSLFFFLRWGIHSFYARPAIGEIRAELKLKSWPRIIAQFERGQLSLFGVKKKRSGWRYRSVTQSRCSRLPLNSFPPSHSTPFYHPPPTCAISSPTPS